MHRWHHAKDLPGVEAGLPAEGANFATKFAFWDWLLGSAFRPAQRKPRAYGLFDDNGPFPEGYFRQVIAAFRPFDQPVVKLPAPAVAAPAVVENATSGTRG